MANINDTYFDGYYKDIWKALIPTEFSSKEVDFMLEYFRLQPGDHVLDLMCGYGRHTLGLAKRGVNVTAVDNLTEYIDEINAKAEEANLPIKALRQDVANYEPDGTFDLVICMGNSLNFFDSIGTQRIFNRVSSHLKSGGYFLINSWSIAEIAFRQFSEKAWSYTGELKFLTDSQFHILPNRIETEHFLISPMGQTETKKSVDYIFSINEIAEMLNNASIELEKVYSVPGKKIFKLGEPRAYIVARKI